MLEQSSADEESFEQTVNDNAEFVEVIEGDDLTIDEEGNLQTSYTPTEAGHYAFFLAQPLDKGDGFSTHNNDLSVSGETRIIGMESVPVQTRRSSADLVRDGKEVEAAENEDVYADPGETLTFKVDSLFSSEGEYPDSTEHMVLVYEKSTFVNSNLDITVTKDDDGNIEDVSTTSDITSVNGHVNVAEESTSFQSMGDGELNPTMSINSAGEIVSEAHEDDSDDGQEIDASLTAISGDSQDTVNVETNEDWDETKYVYVHIAVGDDPSQFAVDQGSLCLKPEGETCYDPGEEPDEGDNSGDGDGDDSENDGDDDNNAGGGGGGGAPAGGSDDGDSGPDRIKAKESNGQMTASTGTVFAGQTVGFNVDNDGSLKNFDITMENTVSGFNVDYADLDSQPGSVTTPPMSAVRFFEVNANGVSDDDIDNVKFNFRLDSSELPEGVSPDDVQLLRFHDGEWQTLETKHRNGDNYRASSPGFTVYAIGYDEPAQPSFALSSPSLAGTTASVGQATEVSATVENTGDAAGTYTVDLTANGDVVDTKEVTVPAGESEQVTFSVSFDEAGTYDLAINGEALGAITVQDEPVDQVDNNDDTNDGDDETGGSLLSGPVVLVLVLIVVVIGVAVALAKREDLQEKLK
ncbi:PGF-pre-PGF domain-containing protein [Haloprofundus marisrubri]|nr:PGF-pre-PGF domain-containing protein [Haloprofundus marisrubri]